MKRIYLDNNATTPLDPRVLEAMMADLGSIPANPSSIHSFGQEARQKLIAARHTIAEILRVKPGELIFTSGGTEALNTILRSIPEGHIITSDIEHSAIARTLATLKGPITYLPAGLYGAVLPESVKEAILPDTKLIVLSAVNNETGVKTDIKEIAKIAERANIPFLVDAVAWLGKERIALHPGVTAACFSGHKIHGPKGIGLLFARKSFKFAPLLTGGPQEQNHRGGTENLAGILGLAKAIELLQTELPDKMFEMQRLRDYFETRLKELIPNIAINGEGPRICNTSNIAFPGSDAETLLIELDLLGLAASHGSACSAGALEPSRVLTNMGLPRDLVRSSLRFSLSRMTTQEEIDRSIDIISQVINIELLA
jgi:cysteine desulfurase